MWLARPPTQFVVATHWLYFNNITLMSTDVVCYCIEFQLLVLCGCKTEVDVNSLLQAILPPGLVEDEVDTYAALGFTGRGSELSIEQKRGYVCGFPHFV